MMAAKTDKKAAASDATLERLIGYYDSFVDATVNARAKSERDRDYYDNKQFTSEEESELKNRGQPIIVRNRIKPKVDNLLGIELQSRMDPRGYPRNPQDEEGAHAATDSVRYVCDKENFPAKASDGFKDLFIEGAEAFIVPVRAYGERREICIDRIPWDRYFYDPHSYERNFSDAKFKGIVVWIDLEDAQAAYGDDVEKVYEQSVKYDSTTHADRPKHRSGWSDDTRKRLKLCEIYWKEKGKWKYAVFTAGGYAVKPQDSPYIDEHGAPTCPIEGYSCHVDRDGTRYGGIRQLIGPQDEINKRAIKAVHLLVASQTAGERGAVDDIDELKRQKADPHGHIEFNPGHEFQFRDHTDMAAANLGMLQEAKGEIDAIGASAALQGKDRRSTSGRQDELKQNSALSEVAPALDAHKQLKLAVYRQVWARVKQHWTAPMMIRVTDDERNIKFVGLNQPAVDENGQPVIDPQTGQQAVQNNTAEIYVDFTLEESPDVATLESEESTKLMELAKTYGPEIIPVEVAVEALAFRPQKKRRIMEMLEQRTQQAQQQPGVPPEMQQHAQTMMGAEAATAVAGAEKAQADAQTAQAKALEANAKARNEIERPAIEAQRHEQGRQDRMAQAAQRPPQT